MDEEATPAPRARRVFINRIDSFLGRSLARHLSGCVVGASLESMEGMEEEDEEEEAHDEMDGEGSGQGPSKAARVKMTYQVVGTLRQPESPEPDFVQQIVKPSSREDLLYHLMECDIIVYNITEDADQTEEASWAVTEIHEKLKSFENPKVFVLLSTIMTWARTRPLDPDDPELDFTEEDYRRRKPHPNFTQEIDVERLVIKLGKTNKTTFSTFVLACGLMYGMGESVFHHFFKTAWLGELSALPIYGPGSNIVPTIHVKDVAGVVQNILDRKPKVHYLLATDSSKHTLEELVKAISKHLGPGKTIKVPKEEALLLRDLMQSDYDHLLVNLRFDAQFLRGGMNIHWVAEGGLVENIATIVREYKETRGLLPMRGCVLGPPAVGKTSLVEKLCKHYRLHHIKAKDVIDEAIERLERIAARAQKEGEEEEHRETGEEEDEGGEAEEEGESAQDAQELLEAVKESLEQNNGRLEDTYLVRFFKEKLRSMSCQNQGFILDGFPKTYAQAKELFTGEDDAEEEEDAISGKENYYDKSIIPDLVVSLEAPDEFLRDRVMNLPEAVVAGTHYTEEATLRRLAAFRAHNTVDETILNYFEEQSVAVAHYDVTKEDAEFLLLVHQLLKRMGEPRNYGLTAEEREEIFRRAAEERMRQEAEKWAEWERHEVVEAVERERKLNEWQAKLEAERRREQELLARETVPLREYLLAHVMPTLTTGLIECCSVRPPDPVDFLAEYIFKNNPQAD
ncbi:adenylate kinase 7 [Petromyzon marinus]|uniref:Adenylate kinase 7 n=1 Tax=Petromyzon marinus TaxID=7757 RepID=A0AAJ7WNP3_PETMA|nr:adenylate kinase 7 [Petromyzon marinus]